MFCKNIICALRLHPEAGFVILFEMFQRFAYFSFQTVLFLYIKHELKFSLGASIALYHTFLALGFLAPIIFSIIADKCLSKYCTIIIAALIALIGDILVTVAASALGSKGISLQFQYIMLISMLGLVIRSIGIGGMREVVRSFGSDQFCLPQEEYYLRAYYQAFYYATVFGTVAGIITAPLLRMQVECFGQIYCFPLAFGVATIAMFLAILALLCGCTALNKGEPTGSVVTETWVCISTAFTNRGRKCGPTWLDNATVLFTDRFICDVRATLRVLVLYLPLPFFWALFELQGSLWVYQASRMIWPLSLRRELYVEPDHMQVVTHIVVFIALPLIETYLYSICRRIYCCRTALKRIMIGALFAVLAFVVAALIELKVEPTYANVPKQGEAHIVAFNSFNKCPLHIDIEYVNSTNRREAKIMNVDHVFIRNLPVTETQLYLISIAQMLKEYEDCDYGSTRTTKMKLAEGKVIYIFITFILDPGKGTIKYPPTDDLPFDLEKCDIQLPMMNIVYSSRHTLGLTSPYDTAKFVKYDSEKNTSVYLDSNHHGIPPFHLHPSKYGIYGETEGWGKAFDFNLRRGGVYTTIFAIKGSYITRNVTTLTKPNSVHMSWQIPQFVLIALAYFLCPVTLLQFSYQQVPVRMKPLLLVCWYLTIALGNLLVVSLAFVVTRLFWFYVIYATIMAGAMFLMMVIFCNYRVVWPEDKCQRDCLYECWSESECK